MKEITELELLKFEDIEKVKILKAICEGRIKYIGGKDNEKKRV